MVSLNGAEELLGEKAYDPESIGRSVVDVPSEVNIPPTDQGFVWFLAQSADGITPWGKAPKIRDRQLRDFIPTEPWLNSALASVCSRNTAFSWRLEGPDALVQAAQEMLVNANRGKGWQSFVTQLSMDLYSQDCGAFIELIRAGDTPTSPVINVAHLDSGRCYQTGNPEVPVIYLDRLGRIHRLKWYQVWNMQEMPSGVEAAHAGVFYDLQYSAVTRLLRSAQILRSISIMTDEKAAGRWTKAVHIVRGVNPDKIQQAIEQAKMIADQQGLMRYMQPPIIGSHDPLAEIDVKTIELASLRDNFDEDVMMRWYIAVLALAFLVDYQEFAPLPGGNLGTSAQSQVLHMKSRGKGPGLFMKLFAHFMNFGGVLPRSVTFEWDEQDVDADKAQAELEGQRATARKTRVESNEIDATAAREIAVMQGDLTQEQFDAIEQREAQRRAEDEKRREAIDQSAEDDRRAGAPVDSGPSDGDVRLEDNERGQKAVAPGRAKAEEIVADQVKDELDDLFDELAEELRRRPIKTADDFHRELKRDLGQKGGLRRVVTKFRRDRKGAITAAEQEERWA